jgi:hypothetical protein
VIDGPAPRPLPSLGLKVADGVVTVAAAFSSRVGGPISRKLFEQFLRKVNKLQMQQHLEARAQGDTERSRERGPG